jgi:NRAMP (natural resistance-associated macrophage protein)-like metal ion transporter
VNADTESLPQPSRRQPWWHLLGPGLITGAADDDPSGIATYAQAGAQFGFGLGWTLLLTYPLMVAIQAISARIGRTTGLGLAGNMRRHYSSTAVGAIVTVLCIANILNLGADLGAMADAAHLLFPLRHWAYVLAFATFCTVCQVYFQHTRYVAILKWLTISLLAYFATACVVHIQWRALLLGLVWPRLSFDRQFWSVVVAILGTTISPYLFFWQAAQEVEDTKAHPERQPLWKAPHQAPSALARIRIDTLVGMAVSNLVALAILVTSAATLHASGIHQIDTATQAAEALRPLAGDFAFTLFALGIISTGLISVPVLAGSAAYALGEARQWNVGLCLAPRQAKAFYGAIVAATLLGVLENAFGISPIRALMWAAILNGVVAVPVMFLVMLLASHPRVMGSLNISRRVKVAGWSATAVMTAASVLFFLTLV